ncbi:MAG TPA: phospholipase D-like domain-containing protein [Bacteroidales bacterium]|nr:phospholipase D-like domain-containing protein [Bacteroidales bacterium]HRZ77095.1 phospholipase D-like domain-containing protein [Bacteroidales bacterium]
MEHREDSYQLYDDPFRFYAAMLHDIGEARQEILVETYRFNHDAIGERFRDALVKKASQGVKVKILVDSWGTGNSDAFFASLLCRGGELRYFKKIKLFWDFFTKNHKRNHRKLLVVDHHIAWTGSANFTAYSLNWREMMVRAQGSLAPVLARTFHESYDIYKKYIFKKFAFKKTLYHQGFEIVRDLPSIYRQQIKTRFQQLIRKARRQVVIETPYFLPGHILRRDLMDAAQRGVEVIVLVPQHSDVRVVDLLRNRYLGMLHRAGLQLRFYQPHNLHAKVMMIDGEVFSIGSANFDYRSFRYMYEMTLIGEEASILQQLAEHIQGTLRDSVPFDYKKWQRRPRIERVFERLLLPFRHLL